MGVRQSRSTKGLEVSRTKSPSACSGAGSSAEDPAGGVELVGELFGGEATELGGLPSGEPDLVLDASAILRLALLYART